jgi:hypothetical protein
MLSLVATCIIVPSIAQVDADLANRLQFSLDSVCSIYRIKGVSAAVLIPSQGIWEGTLEYLLLAHPFQNKWHLVWEVIPKHLLQHYYLKCNRKECLA